MEIEVGRFMTGDNEDELVGFWVRGEKKRFGVAVKGDSCEGRELIQMLFRTLAIYLHFAVPSCCC